MLNTNAQRSRGKMLADQGGKCFFYVEKRRNKAEPKESGDYMKENELSPKLELIIRRLISENRHRTKFQKKRKILSEIPPEIVCSKVALSQKSKEFSRASTLSG